MDGIKIYDSSRCSSCYFRTGPKSGQRKALLQITEKCNLRCEHCFVSSTETGNLIGYKDILDKVIPQFVDNSIAKVTITGGEPLIHPKLYEIVKSMTTNGISVGICTNATLITDDICELFSTLNNVHFNASLDGFSEMSHGRFRGSISSNIFKRTITGLNLLSDYKLLQGILCTPNIFTPLEEYAEICNFAREKHARYVLFNPLSEFGRGENNIELAYSADLMEELKALTLKYISTSFEVVYIRFPNTNRLPLCKCPAGDITYIFTNGDVAICPYMAFSSKDRISQYNYDSFIIGNIFERSFDYNDAIERYSFPVSYNDVCKSCSNRECMKGCFAARIAKGLSLAAADEELCPLNIKGSKSS